MKDRIEVKIVASSEYETVRLCQFYNISEPGERANFIEDWGENILEELSLSDSIKFTIERVKE